MKQNPNLDPSSQKNVSATFNNSIPWQTAPSNAIVQSPSPSRNEIHDVTANHSPPADDVPDSSALELVQEVYIHRRLFMDVLH